MNTRAVKRFAERTNVSLPYYWLRAFGFDGIKCFLALRGLPAYFRDYVRLRRSQAPDFPLRLSMPCLGDRFLEAGSVTGHYFFQDLYVARRIFERDPERHVDVGSRIDGFVAHVASGRRIEVLDVRRMSAQIHNVTFHQVDLMSLSDQWMNACDSLSCLHALEHFGLGRYGDRVDFRGYERGFANLTKIVRSGGAFYLSVPIGPQRIEFNAHRVFAVGTILEMALEKFELLEFSFVDDAGKLHERVPLTPEMISEHCGCTYGCGIFELRKR